jgi:O-antigen/teichoic acid export membrane protein
VSGRVLLGQRVSLALPASLAPFRRTLGTTAGLVVATALNSLTGFIFWWIAARQFPPEAVSVAGVAVSAMILLSQVSVLGLGTSLAGVLHREQRVASLAVTALIAAGGAGALLALSFGILAPALFPAELGPISASPLALLVFVAGVSLTTLSSVLDQVLVALFRNAHQLLRNAVFSLGRLVLLGGAAVVLAPVGMVIYGAWTAGVIVSLATLVALAHQARLAGHVRPLMWRTLADMTRGTLAHHVLNLSRSSSIWLLPLVVTVVLSHEANAAFYIAMLLANFISVIGTSATFTLYVVGARAPDRLWRQLRFTLGLSTVAALAGTAVLALAGEQLLAAFGDTYRAAFPTVAILALSCLPLVVKDHWIAIQRVHGGVGMAALVGVAALIAELVAAGIGAANGGLIGLAVARFAVLTAQAAFMAIPVYRALLPGSTHAVDPGMAARDVSADL